MNIAIMGAGLSGLVSSFILEQNGLAATIFEKRGQVGERFLNAEIFFAPLAKPVIDPVRFISDKYGIALKPAGNFRNLILFSRHRKATITGHLGFVNLRGRDPDSFENQLARLVKSKIVFNSSMTYARLQRDFTHIVMATGDGADAAQVQDYRMDLTATIRGVDVNGKFDHYTVMAWLDTGFAPKGYGYLLPYSETRANIALWYPDYPENTRLNSSMLWDRFFERVCRDLDQELAVTDHFEINRYIIGNCRYPRIGNTFFTGNCFGAITPYLGFGQFVSILTGVYAALDICGKGNYEQLAKPLQRNYQNSLVLRRAWEQLDDPKFDLMVKVLGTTFGNALFNTRHFDVMKLASYLARPWIRPRTLREV